MITYLMILERARALYKARRLGRRDARRDRKFIVEGTPSEIMAERNRRLTEWMRWRAQQVDRPWLEPSESPWD